MPTYYFEFNKIFRHDKLTCSLKKMTEVIVENSPGMAAVKLKKKHSIQDKSEIRITHMEIILDAKLDGQIN